MRDRSLPLMGWILRAPPPDSLARSRRDVVRRQGAIPRGMPLLCDPRSLFEQRPLPQPSHRARRLRFHFTIDRIARRGLNRFVLSPTTGFCLAVRCNSPRSNDSFAPWNANLPSARRRPEPRNSARCQSRCEASMRVALAPYPSSRFRPLNNRHAVFHCRRCCLRFRSIPPGRSIRSIRSHLRISAEGSRPRDR
jgi:hypothetical protein